MSNANQSVNTHAARRETQFILLWLSLFLCVEFASVDERKHTDSMWGWHKRRKCCSMICRSSNSPSFWPWERMLHSLSSVLFVASSLCRVFEHWIGISSARGKEEGVFSLYRGLYTHSSDCISILFFSYSSQFLLFAQTLFSDNRDLFSATFNTITIIHTLSRHRTVFAV